MGVGEEGEDCPPLGLDSPSPPLVGYKMNTNLMQNKLENISKINVTLKRETQTQKCLRVGKTSWNRILIHKQAITGG